MTDRRVSAEHLADARVIWDYHLVGHELRPCSAAIGLGSHDIGVATFASELYHAGMFPVLVFSGATSATTETRFPRGEAVEFAEHAMRLGVPASAIIIEPRAANTGQNIDFSRTALAEAGVEVTTLMLISKPYMERRSLATARKAWPEADLVCASQPLPFDDYLTAIGDEKFVIDMIVGDLQRVIDYPSRGFAVPQDVPADVRAAYRRLTAAGYTGRLAA